MRYAYFSGCSAKTTCSELDTSMRVVAEAMDLDLLPLRDAGCTGARELRVADPLLFRVANARIMALAEAAGADLMVVCDTCLLNLLEVRKQLGQDPTALGEINQWLEPEGLCYRGQARVRHFLWILLEDLAERLSSAIRRPLTGVRIGPYYGCHILRPRSLYSAGTSDQVASLEELIRILGGEPVGFGASRDCCGFHVLAADDEIPRRLGATVLQQARDLDVDVLVTPCPLCHTVLDGMQPEICAGARAVRPLPVLHLAQLVGLALGRTPRDLGISRHVVPLPRSLVPNGDR